MCPARFAACADADASRPLVAASVISHPDRVVFPVCGATKLDLARYYEAIADWIVPHVADRPLTLVRCPNGVRADGAGKACDCFYHEALESCGRHRRCGASASARRRKIGEYLIADTLAALVGLVQMDVLEVHTWNSRLRASSARPDRHRSRSGRARWRGRQWSRRRGWSAGCSRRWISRASSRPPAAAACTSSSHCAEGRLGRVPGLCAGDRRDARAPRARCVHRRISQSSDASTRSSWTTCATTGRTRRSRRTRRGRGRMPPCRFRSRGASSRRRALPNGSPSDTVPQRLARLHADPWKAYWRSRQTIPRGAVRALQRIS